MRIEPGQTSAAAVAGATKASANVNAEKVEKVEKVETAKPDSAGKAKADQARQKEISEQAGALYSQNGQQTDIQKQQNRQLAEVV